MPATFSPSETLRRARDWMASRGLTELSVGRHEQPNGKCDVCAQELICVLDRALDPELPWTDTPRSLGFDVRSINDARWSSGKVRADAMVPLVARLHGSSEWPEERRRIVADHLIVAVVSKTLPPMLREVARVVPSHAEPMEAAAKACEVVRDRAAAAAAARAAAYAAAAADAAAAAAAAAYAAAAYAAAAARAAADAAAYAADATAAADAADAAAADSVLLAHVADWHAALDAAGVEGVS